MSQPTWTTTKPDKPGVYWYRSFYPTKEQCHLPIAVNVVTDGYGLVVYGIGEYCLRLYELDGHWAGPLTPPGEAEGGG